MCLENSHCQNPAREKSTPPNERKLLCLQPSQQEEFKALARGHKRDFWFFWELVNSVVAMRMEVKFIREISLTQLTNKLVAVQIWLRRISFLLIRFSEKGFSPRGFMDSEKWRLPFLLLIETHSHNCPPAVENGLNGTSMSFQLQ